MTKPATHRIPGRSGISAQSLSNFPGADVPGLSKPHSGGVTASGPNRHCGQQVVGCVPLSHLLSAATRCKSACRSTMSEIRYRSALRGSWQAPPALNLSTAASAVQSPQAPHESTWSLSNRMHTASGAVL